MVENSDNFIVNNLELYGTKTLKNQNHIIKCTDSDTLSLNKVSFMNNYNQLYDLVNDIEVTSKYTNNQTKININNSIFFVIDISSTSNLIFNKFTDCLEISIFSCIFQGRSFSQAIYLYS